MQRKGYRGHPLSAADKARNVEISVTRSGGERPFATYKARYGLARTRLMRKSRLSQYKQRRLVEHFIAGTTARCAANLCGVNRKSAAYYFRRLREIISHELEQAEQEVFAGEIEVDESYFGGKRKGKRGRGAGGKIPVFGLLKRGGTVYSKIIPNASSKVLHPIIERKVVPDSIVYSDCWRGYNHINGIENFWSQASVICAP